MIIIPTKWLRLGIYPIFRQTQLTNDAKEHALHRRFAILPGVMPDCDFSNRGFGPLSRPEPWPNGSCEAVGLLWTHNECLPLSTNLAWDFHAGPVMSHLQHRAFDPIFLTFRYIERPRIDRLNFVSWTRLDPYSGAKSWIILGPEFENAQDGGHRRLSERNTRGFRGIFM